MGRSGLKWGVPSRLFSSLRPSAVWLAIGMLVTGLWVDTVAAADGRLADFSRVMRRWGVDDGLLGSRVNSVAQTPDGMLWVATERGLFQFNGRRFFRLDTEKVKGFEVSGISTMLADSEGTLWLLSHKNAVATYRDGSFQAHSLPEGLSLGRWSAHPDGGVLAYLLDRDKLIRGTIVRMEAGGWIETLADDVGRYVTAMHADADGRIWIGRSGLVLAELKDGQIVNLTDGTAGGTGRFLRRRSGELLAVATDGIHQWTGESWQRQVRFEHELPKPAHFAIEDSDGRIWFGCHDLRHSLWEPGRGVVEFRDGRQSLPAVVQGACSDTEGNLWFASFSGLHQARYVPFITWKPPEEIPTERIFGLRTHRDGTVLFYGFGGLCRLAPGAPQATFEMAFPGADLTQGDTDRSGRIWTASRHGLLYLHEDGEKIRIPARDLKPRFHPNTLTRDEEGIMWMASTAPRRLFRCDPDEEPAEFLPVSGQGLPKESSVLRKVPGYGLFVLAAGHGLYLKKYGDDEWRQLSPTGNREGQLCRYGDYSPSGGAWSISRTSEITYWGETPLTAPLDQVGLGAIKVSGMALDDVGCLWISTSSHGVVMAKLDELRTAMSTPGTQSPFLWFDQTDGLGSKGGSFVVDCIHRAHDGKIWIATDGGLSMIDPRQWQRERERSKPLELFGERWSADGDPLPYSPSGDVIVQAGVKRIGVDLTPRTFGPAEEVSYRYRLVGMDEQWIENGSLGEIFFQGLKPGPYQLQVLLGNRFGIWTPVPFERSVVITPYWWQRPGVQLVGVLLVVLISAWIVRLRLQSARAQARLHADYSRQLIASQEDERRRIAHELHDSLGQEMLVLKGRLDLTAMKNPELEPMLDGLSNQFSETIERARSLSHDLRPPQLEHFGLSKALEALAREVDEAAVIEVTHNIDDLDPRLAAEQEIGLFRIAQEAMANVLKHSEASEAILGLHKHDETVTLSVRDNGRGFNPDERGKESLGLAGMMERSKLLNAGFQCHAAPGKGTEVTVSLNLKN